MQKSDKSEKVLFQPKVFDFSRASEKQDFEDLVAGFSPEIKNTLNAQIADLVSCTYPEELQSGTSLEKLTERWLAGKTAEECANMVYFPWRNSAAWMLKERDFASTRTNRNRNKIPAEIQQNLEKKSVLFVGLSVGQSAALTFAMQRVCGTLHLVDFDTLSLSNMNRLRASLLDIDLPKTVIAARQIAEQDPYLNVHCHFEGATVENIDRLITQDGKGNVDLIVEECDSLEIKILIRQRARFFGVPVIMDTSDRGLVDVERFDLEKNRPLFHGIVKEEELPPPGEKLNPAARFQLLQKIVNFEKLSDGMKSSLGLLGKSLLTWPQLAYEVTLGGALTTFVGYKILAGLQMDSGRVYVDLEQIFKEEREWI